MMIKSRTLRITLKIVSIREKIETDRFRIHLFTGAQQNTGVCFHFLRMKYTSLRRLNTWKISSISLVECNTIDQEKILNFNTDANHQQCSLDILYRFYELKYLSLDIKKLHLIDLEWRWSKISLFFKLFKWNKSHLMDATAHYELLLKSLSQSY